MRSRRSAQDEVAEVARRRLALLSAELAGIRPDTADPPESAGQADLGEPIPERTGPAPREPDRPGRHARRGVGPVAGAAGWLVDRLPPTMQGRVQLGATHLTVVAVAVAAALGVTAWWVSRADGGGTTLPPPVAGAPPEALVTPAAVASDPAGPTGSGTGEGAAAAVVTATATIVVDVTGKVRRPGIATLPAGSRVVDALKAAGGVRPGVSLRSLNLARVLLDGEQVVVGVPPPGGVAAPAASAPQVGGSAPLVNINTAGTSELEELPGVGPVTAQAIVQWRTDNGPFAAVDDLLDVSGIGEATLAEMAPFVTL